MTALDFLAIITATVLVAVGAIHVYWGGGGVWPAKDTESLVDLVIGMGPDKPMPGLGLSLLVAGAMLAGGALLLVARGVLPLDPSVASPAVVRWLVWAMAGVFALRGLGGLVERWIRPEIQGTRYGWASPRIYSPLCLLLAAASVAVVL